MCSVFQFTGSQESILHLDLEDGNLNSSDSRESESPSQDHLTHLPVRYAEPSASSSAGDCPQHRPGDTGTRKSSLISLVRMSNCAILDFHYSDKRLLVLTAWFSFPDHGAQPAVGSPDPLFPIRERRVQMPLCVRESPRLPLLPTPNVLHAGGGRGLRHTHTPPQAHHS